MGCELTDPDWANRPLPGAERAEPAGEATSAASVSDYSGLPQAGGSVYFKSSAAVSELASATVDLVVTSPPYYCVKDYARDGHQDVVHSPRHPEDYGAIRGYRDYLAALLDTWRECFRVLKPNGKLAINAPLLPMPKRVLSTHHNRDIFNIYADIERSILERISGIYLLDIYIRNRSNGTKGPMFGSYPYPRNRYAQNTAEFIGVFVKEGKPAEISEAAKAASALSQEEWLEYTKPVWTLPSPSRADLAWGKPPAIMPEEVARRCIRLFSCVGDLVLDPFAGLGTTLMAAKEQGRRYVGYEGCRNYEGIIAAKLSFAGG